MCGPKMCFTVCAERESMFVCLSVLCVHAEYMYCTRVYISE